MLDQHAVARIHVNAVAIGIDGADGQVPRGEVFAKQRMNGPELLVLRREIFKHRIGAAGELDQHRAARVAKLAEIQRRPKNRTAGDGDIRRIGRTEQGPMTFAEFAFPADRDDGIIGNVRAAKQVGTRRKLQRRVGAQDEAAGQEHAFGELHRAAAGRSTLVERALDRAGVFRHAVSFRTKIKHVQRRLFSGENGGDNI